MSAAATASHGVPCEEGQGKNWLHQTAAALTRQLPGTTDAALLGRVLSDLDTLVRLGPAPPMEVCHPVLCPAPKAAADIIDSTAGVTSVTQSEQGAAGPSSQQELVAVAYKVGLYGSGMVCICCVYIGMLCPSALLCVW